jgi:hypothetical protein
MDGCGRCRGATRCWPERIEGMSSQINRATKQSAWNLLFGPDAQSYPSDSHRASFRRKSLRLGIAGGATIVLVMHVLAILFIALPRGIVGGITAFFWSLVMTAPSIALDVIGAGMLGFVLALASLAVGALIHGATRRMAPGLSRAIMLADAGATGALVFGVVAYMAQIQNPLTAVSQGAAAFVVSLVPLFGGAVLGVLLAQRAHAYFVERLGA